MRDSEERMNRLAAETSPYLLQHAHNPVDWYPWGEEAFTKAKAEDKPVLLSVGYSACHWCHVMERESFQNDQTAALMNRLFVNVKVDREERPDIDEIYMAAVQLLTGRGGWPMTVFLTPDAKPFYGGTYFPPTDRHNIPAFPRVLAGTAQAYKERRTDVDRSTEEILSRINSLIPHSRAQSPVTPSSLLQLGSVLAEQYDEENGGLGKAPKFPNASVFGFFLRCGLHSEETSFHRMTLTTLRKMASGGIYDHLGGGFHRYSVDGRWLVPHFEKMLYDNAILAPLYLEAFQVTGDSFYRDVARDTLAYVEREMLGPHGGFYSSQDADSEGEEGRFFVWEQQEILRELGQEVGQAFSRYYGVTEPGNFEGKNILRPVLDIAEIANDLGCEKDEARNIVRDAKERLFVVREKRTKPACDDKVLTSWNSLTITAYAKAYQVLGTAQYLRIAQNTTQFIWTHMMTDGKLLRTYRSGEAKIQGYLEDYAFFIVALLDLYEATFDRVYLEKARELAEVLVAKFEDGQDGGFFSTSEDHELLISRVKPAFDGSVPSGNSVAALVFLRLFYLTEQGKYRDTAESVFHCFEGNLAENPFAYSDMLCALDLYLHHPKEIMVLGDKDAPDVKALLRKLHQVFVPNKTVRCFSKAANKASGLPSTLRGQPHPKEKFTAYVCHEFTCSLPFSDWESLHREITADTLTKREQHRAR